MTDETQIRLLVSDEIDPNSNIQDHQSDFPGDDNFTDYDRMKDETKFRMLESKAKVARDGGGRLGSRFAISKTRIVDSEELEKFLQAYHTEKKGGENVGQIREFWEKAAADTPDWYINFTGQIDDDHSGVFEHVETITALWVLMTMVFTAKEDNRAILYLIEQLYNFDKESWSAIKKDDLGELLEMAVVSWRFVQNKERRDVEVGPLRNQDHAEEVAREFMEQNVEWHWTGVWNTTVPNEMSVIQVARRIDVGLFLQNLEKILKKDYTNIEKDDSVLKEIVHAALKYAISLVVMFLFGPLVIVVIFGYFLIDASDMGLLSTSCILTTSCICAGLPLFILQYSVFANVVIFHTRDDMQVSITEAYMPIVLLFMLYYMFVGGMLERDGESGARRMTDKIEYVSKLLLTFEFVIPKKGVPDVVEVTVSDFVKNYLSKMSKSHLSCPRVLGAMLFAAIHALIPGMYRVTNGQLFLGGQWDETFIILVSLIESFLIMTLLLVHLFSVTSPPFNEQREAMQIFGDMTKPKSAYKHINATDNPLKGYIKLDEKSNLDAWMAARSEIISSNYVRYRQLDVGVVIVFIVVMSIIQFVRLLIKGVPVDIFVIVSFYDVTIFVFWVASTIVMVAETNNHMFETHYNIVYKTLRDIKGEIKDVDEKEEIPDKEDLTMSKLYDCVVHISAQMSHQNDLQDKVRRLEAAAAHIQNFDDPMKFLGFTVNRVLLIQIVTTAAASIIPSILSLLNVL